MIKDPNNKTVEESWQKSGGWERIVCELGKAGYLNQPDEQPQNISWGRLDKVKIAACDSAKYTG